MCGRSFIMNFCTIYAFISTFFLAFGFVLQFYYLFVATFFDDTRLFWVSFFVMAASALNFYVFYLFC